MKKPTKRRGPGRPRIGSTAITVRFPPPQLAWLDRIAKRLDMQRTEVLRRLVAIYK